MEWERVALDFAWDGSLRDVCVPDTTLEDWEHLLSDLRNCEWPVAFTVDGADCPLPPTAEAAFTLARESSVLLSVRVERLTFNCHFFAADEIEFDLDPREVRGQRDLDALLALMRWLGGVSRKPVLLAEEKWRESSILRVVPPAGCVRYCERGSREGSAG